MPNEILDSLAATLRQWVVNTRTLIPLHWPEISRNSKAMSSGDAMQQHNNKAKQASATVNHPAAVETKERSHEWMKKREGADTNRYKPAKKGSILMYEGKNQPGQESIRKPDLIDKP